MAAASVLSRTISLVPGDGGAIEAAFGFSGDAAGEGIPAESTYSVQGTASSTEGLLLPMTAHCCCRVPQSLCSPCKIRVWNGSSMTCCSTGPLAADVLLRMASFKG